MINEAPLLSFTRTVEARLNRKPDLVRSRCGVMKKGQQRGPAGGCWDLGESGCEAKDLWGTFRYGMRC